MTPDDAELQETPLTIEPPQRASLRRRAVQRLWRAETAYGVMLAGFAALALLAYFNDYFAWDLSIARGLQSLNSPFMLDFMRGVSVPGNGLIPWGLTIIT
ncbi:MAG TPA: hypothetical protein VEQ40_09560, partial [Pyrinomonadaceae bacterium]|nr:hypothetical protein [Pyrinomonadaceae bacterium]